MKNLENYGVQELNVKEVCSTDGGGGGGNWVVALFGWYAYETLNDVESAKSSANAGFAAAQ